MYFTSKKANKKMSAEASFIPTESLKVRDTRPALSSSRGRVSVITGAAVTLDISQMSRNLILHGPLGAPGTLTTPTATQIIRSRSFDFGPFVGAGSDFFIRPNGDSTTLVAGAGVTIVGTATVLDSTTRHFMFRIDNVLTPAVTMYDLGCCGAPTTEQINGASAVGTFNTANLPVGNGATVTFPLSGGVTSDATRLTVDATAITVRRAGNYAFSLWFQGSRTANYTVTMSSSGAGTLTVGGPSVVLNNLPVTISFQGTLTGAAVLDTLFVTITDDGAAAEDYVFSLPPAGSIRVDQIT